MTSLKIGTLRIENGKLQSSKKTNRKNPKITGYVGRFSDNRTIYIKYFHSV